MTKPYEIEELERDLRTPAPEPPERLLTALREDIPQDLAAAASPPRRGWGARPWQLAAATVAIAVVGFFVGDRVRREVPLEVARPVQQTQEAPDTVAESSPNEPIDGPAVAVGSHDGAAGESDLDRELRLRREQIAQTPRPEPKQLGEPPASARAEGAASALEAEAEKRASVDPPEPPRFRPPPAEESQLEERERSAGKSRVAAIPDPTPAAGGEVSKPVAGPAPVPASPEAFATEEAVPAGARPPVIIVRSEAPLLDERKLADAGAAPSTGGSAEPNDQPYGDMFFQSAGVNPFIDTEDDRLSTFGLDVDTGSYTVARSYLQRGHLPPPEAVRVEEFVNFFSYGDEPPRRGDFALSAEGAPSPFAEGRRYQVLRFGVHGREIDRAERKPAVLTFVVDVSGSMGRENRLGLVRRSLQLLLDELDPEDRVGLVVYGSRGRVLLEPSGDHGAIRRAIDALVPEGATNAEEGLVLGYELARRHFREGAINRVILCSDGVANVGRTGPDSILASIAAAAAEGIELTTIGFGMGNYNDVLMEQLADRGDGRYAYIDTFEEARRLFVYDLTGTLETIASDAKVQVDFNPEVVSRYRLLGYENRAIADQRFRDDTVDAGEIGAGHQVSAVYEIKLEPRVRPRDRLARISLRWHSVASGEVEEISLDLEVRDLGRSFDTASPGLRLAAIVGEFGEILRRSYWAREGDLGDLLERAQTLSPAFAGDADVAELVGLIGAAGRLTEKE